MNRRLFSEEDVSVCIKPARTLEPTQQKERRLDKQAEYEVANKRLGETSEQNKDRQGAKKSRR